MRIIVSLCLIVAGLFGSASPAAAKTYGEVILSIPVTLLLPAKAVIALNAHKIAAYQGLGVNIICTPTGQTAPLPSKPRGWSSESGWITLGATQGGILATYSGPNVQLTFPAGLVSGNKIGCQVMGLDQIVGQSHLSDFPSRTSELVLP